MLCKQIFFLLILYFCHSKLYQGPISINQASLVQEKILKSAQTYNLTLRDDLFLDRFETEDIHYQRTNIKCQACQKAFKNSSMLMLHYHRFHLSDDENSRLVDLNYFCLFIKCNQNQPLEDDLKFKMCMEFVHFNVIEGNTWNKTYFCDDLVFDRGFQQGSEWDPLINFFKQIGFYAFLIISFIYEYQVYVYLKMKSGIKRRKTRQQEALMKYYQEGSDKRFKESDHLISIYQ